MMVREIWWLIKPTTTQFQKQGSELTHSNIHLIYELLEYVTEAKGLKPDQ